MRYRLIVLLMLLFSVAPVSAEVSIGIGLPGVSIGINLPMYPELARVPGYPVYYAPRINSNYFFYDGMYWVFQDDEWYASSWYNGPWGHVAPDYVPLYVLRIPVRYYRQPPVYFRGWQGRSPPHWGEHWGSGWEQHRSGWNKWDRRSVPAPAALPIYQRHYAGDRYPRIEQQQMLRSQNYRYQPKEAVVREHYQQQKSQGGFVPPQQGGRDIQRVQPPQDQGKRSQARDSQRESNRGQGQGQGKDHERGQERSR